MEKQANRASRNSNLFVRVRGTYGKSAIGSECCWERRGSGRGPVMVLHGMWFLDGDPVVVWATLLLLFPLLCVEAADQRHVNPINPSSPSERHILEEVASIPTEL